LAKKLDVDRKQIFGVFAKNNREAVLISNVRKHKCENVKSGLSSERLPLVLICQNLVEAIASTLSAQL